MTEGGQPTNRLAEESSPYLRLHRHNPVDWYPWGKEALQRARAEDKPIFLSVGYSTCYWCHVMERESFSDRGVAELMNRDFVCVKVDREERPELDEIYMTATQLLTRHGGWPNSVFLTPELEPFYAGTYFPPHDRQGMPGFPTVLRSVAAAWAERPQEVRHQAGSVAAAMRRYLEESSSPSGSLPPEGLEQEVMRSLERRFDASWGGFGGAPKFPTPANLFFLLELEEESAQAGSMLSLTLDRMARGGIYDQLGGGFHRYATDSRWLIPHFEKMLYDNGLLLEVYARHWRRSRDPETERVVRETAAFLQREMTAAEGGLWSAIDAETGGREGAYYVWTREELERVLGHADYEFLAPLMGFAGSPIFEGDSYVLHLPEPAAEQASRRRMGLAELWGEIAPLRSALLAERDRRPRPATDHKILADWNGMAISGLAVAGRLLGEAALVERAAAAARFVLTAMRPAGGPLSHVHSESGPGIAAFLADYAFLIRGLLALHRADGEGRWLAAAAELAGEQQSRLGDEKGGFFVAAERQDLLFRSKEVLDGAVPAANGIAALNLVELASRTGDRRWSDEAERAVKAFSPLLERSPEVSKILVLAARRLRRLRRSDGDRAAAAVGDEPRQASATTQAARLLTASLVMGEPDSGGWRDFRLSLTPAPGWHLSAVEAPEQPALPARLRGALLEVRSLRAEPGRVQPHQGGSPGTMSWWEGAEIRGELRRGGEGPATLEVDFQLCDDTRCLAPARLELPVAE